MTLRLEDILAAYSIGLFPMADARESEDFHWYDPPKRGQLSIPRLHVPKRLRRTVLSAPYKVTVDTAFEAVIDGCAAAADTRPQTWINPGIRNLFVALYQAGFAHSVECWQGEELAGGLYGLALGGAFMGESMFSRQRDASKIALVHLCARLWGGGFTVLDTQFLNPHLMQFGAFEIDKAEYLARLQEALQRPADFDLPAISEKELVSAYFEMQRTQ